MDDRLKHYLDHEGRIKRWPSAVRYRHDRTALLNYLAAKFDMDKSYTEREVNDRLKRYHTFGDWAMLRRELVEQGYMHRERDGSRYWVIAWTKHEYQAMEY